MSLPPSSKCCLRLCRGMQHFGGKSLFIFAVVSTQVLRGGGTSVFHKENVRYPCDKCLSQYLPKEGVSSHQLIHDILSFSE